MARESERVAREYHGPRHVGWAPVQLRVDEVADPSEEEPRRPCERQCVGNAPERNAPNAREYDAGGGHSEYGAVEREPAPPHLKNVERSIEIVTGLVHNRVQNPRADQHPDDEV